jgi:ketosteroid isomerase-like protein
MPTPQENIELAEAAYGAIASGDVPWLQAHTSEAVVFQQGGRFPTAGTFVGREAMFGHFLDFMTMVGGDFSITTNDLMASEERVAAYITVTVGVGPKRLTFDEVHLWTMSDGLLVDLRALPFDPYAVDEFFADALGVAQKS